MEIKLLSCPLCMKPHFEGVDSLRSTLISVATSHLSCPVCNESLLGLDKLTIHLFSHINNNNERSSDKNNSEEMNLSIVENAPRIVNNNRSNHTKTIPRERLNQNTEKNKQVPIEGIKETNAKELIAECNKNEENEISRCDLCNFYFNDKVILELHQKLLHQTIPDQATGISNYHCHLCSKKFKKRGSLMVHLRVAHYSYSHQSNSFCKPENSSDSSKIQKVKEEPNSDAKMAKQLNSQKTNENKQWECDVCSKLFTTKYFLKKHKRLHTGEMPYSCTQCNKYFTFQQSYHKHMLYHSSEKPYVCNECGRAFKELSTLQNHARIHSGERPFVCETCGKRFRQRVSYLVHRRIHTGVMPYKCTACNKSFRYKVSQRSHKCPASPPGVVVKSSELLSLDHNSFDVCDMSNESKCTLAVDFTTGNINFPPGSEPRILESSSSNNSLLKESIVLSNNEQIQITYNKYDLRSALGQGESSVNAIRPEGSFREHDSGSPKDIQQTQENGQPDLFSMILSPLLPEVESLCLSNNSPASNCENNGENENEMLTTMNEDSLKELIYGVLNKCE